MSLASTSQLLVELNLAGNFASGISSAESKLGTFSSAASGAGSKIESFAGKLKTGLGNALTTFEGRIKSFAGSVTKYLGLGGALSIGGVIEQSIKKLDDFGLALEKVQTLTGETAKDSGTLILLFERFGLGMDKVATVAGFAEKTLGKLNDTTAKVAKTQASAALKALELQKAYLELHNQSVKHIDLLIKEQKAQDQINSLQAKSTAGLTKLAAIDKQYGLQLIDSQGKVVSFSEELNQLANFYDSSASASTKAYVASQLLGKQYATLAPVLAQGSAAIRQAAQEADQLGLGNADTAQKIADFRNSMRDLGAQVNILELQIGMALLPVVQRFADRITGFVTTNGPQIAKFFGDLGVFVENTAGTIYDVGHTIAGFWNTIPEPVRNLLVTGIAGDRIIKYLFGFDIAGTAFGALKNAIVSGMAGGVGKSLAAAGIGKLFVQPVYVTNPGFGTGGIPGLPGAAGAGAEGAGVSFFSGILPALAVALVPVAAVAVAMWLEKAPSSTAEKGAVAVANSGRAYPGGRGGSGGYVLGVGPVTDTSSGAEATDQLIHTRRDLTDAIDAADMAIRTGAIGVHALTAAAQKFQWASETLAERLKHSVAPHSQVNAWLRQAERIAKSSESTDQKINGLEEIKKKLGAGDHHQSYYLDRLITAENARKPTTVNTTVNVNVKGGPTYRVTTTTHASTDTRFAGYLVGGGA